MEVYRCGSLDRYFEVLNEYEKLYAKNFGSDYDDCTGINQKEKPAFYQNKYSILPIHERLSKVDLKDTQMDFDASSFYPSAMWDKKSLYAEI